MLRSRFDTTKAGLAGLCIAVFMSGCANVGQQGATAGNAGSGGPAAADAQASAAAAQSAAQSGDDASTVSRTTTVTKTVRYRVKRGDTLAGVAQKHGCSVKELLAWNGMKSSARIKKGQVLRIVTHQTITTTTVAKAAAGNAASANPAQSREMAAQTERSAKSVALAWPAKGTVVEPFTAGETRGIEIAGNAGDPVLAAADGRVMYAGTGLNEYGSLIIVQHNKDFLTAYSHNRKLLVKTGDIVHQGQEIAEMGNENNTRVSVLFELRHDGKPVDPMPYLPPQGHG